MMMSSSAAVIGWQGTAPISSVLTHTQVIISLRVQDDAVDWKTGGKLKQNQMKNGIVNVCAGSVSVRQMTLNHMLDNRHIKLY